MGREYTTRRTSRPRSRAPNQFLVIIVTFLLGYGTATFFDIDTVSRWISTQVLAPHEVSQLAQRPNVPRHAAVPAKPKFEFYTLLTHEKNGAQSTKNLPQTNSALPANAVKTTTVTAQNAVRNAATAVVRTNTMEQSSAPTPVKLADVKTAAGVNIREHNAFSIQVASFKLRQDAEHMKGLLTLKGFNVSILPIKHVSSGIWFRVIVGPYANRNSAQKAQIDLARNERLRGVLTAG